MTIEATLPRLYVNADLAAGVTVEPTQPQSHYLLAVMRRAAGDSVLLFNGRDGEWRASLAVARKRHVRLAVTERQRAQVVSSELWLVFALLRPARLDFLVEKATELGVTALVPVLTQRGVVRRTNMERLRSIAIEAAEQCERLTLPIFSTPQPLGDFLMAWERGPARRLLLLDEAAARRGETSSIAAAARAPGAQASGLIVGPEGGFTPDERATLRACSFVVPVTLGPRILRAETAGLAGLACWQALCGDWAQG